MHATYRKAKVDKAARPLCLVQESKSPPYWVLGKWLEFRHDDHEQDPWE